MAKIFWYLIIASVGMMLSAHAQVSNSGVEEGRCVVKIKPALRSFFETSESKIFTNSNPQFGKTEVSRLFPLHFKPNPAINRRGETLVDLTLYYEIKFSESVSAWAVVAKLQNLKSVEFAEPFFTVETLLTPNDPAATLFTGAQFNHLNRIKAYDAWAVSQGDSTVIIGSIDTGILPNHEEFRNQIAYNLNDPINGIDDDNNGYIDDFVGWNFAAGSNNVSFSTSNDGHGVVVASQSSAATNNRLGVAGLGFKCKLLPMVIFGPNRTGRSAYESIVYGADRGCAVLNLSWGRDRFNKSQYEQDIINYATINKGVVVVAAAGNTPREINFLPACYTNVLSVTYSDLNDNLAGAATWSPFVGLSAPGVGVHTLLSNGSYGSGGSGSSFASPMVAATAGLIKARFPNLDPRQIAELLRVNTDPYPNPDPAKFGMIGSGRLNMQKAVNRSNNVSLRVQDAFLFSRRGKSVQVGDSAFLGGNLFNFLSPVLFSRLEFRSLTPNFRVLTPLIQTGLMPEMSSISLNNQNIAFQVMNGFSGSSVLLEVTISASNYSEKQVIRLPVNLPYLNIENDRLNVSFASNGRIGFSDNRDEEGIGFRLDGRNLLRNAGIIIASAANKVSNNILDTLSKDEHFLSLQPLGYSKSADRIVISGRLNDTPNILAKVGVELSWSATNYLNSPANRAIVLEYRLRNINSSPIDSVSLGLYTDWDLGDFQENKSLLDRVRRIFVSRFNGSRLWPTSLVAGVSLVSKQPYNFYASDLDTRVIENNFNLYQGFSLNQKFLVTNGGLSRDSAGFSFENGINTATILSAKAYNLAPNQEQVFVFILGAGANDQDFQQAIGSARTRYTQGRTGAVPMISDQVACYGSLVRLSPQNGTNFKFYSNASLTNLLTEGRFHSIQRLTGPTTIFITNADSTFESFATAVQIIPTGPSANFSSNPPMLDIRQGRNVAFTYTGVNGSFFDWDFGNGFRSNLRNPTTTFNTIGLYPVKLKVRNNSTCVDSLTIPFRVTDGVTSLAVNIENEELKLFPNPSSGTFKLIGNYSEGVNYQAFDTKGKLVKLGLVQGNEIDLTTVAEGVYFIHFFSQSGIKLGVQKAIMQKAGF